MSGQIFISYRRDDASYPAGRLYDRLSATLPKNQIFIDVDNLDPGVDFFEAIEASVGSCDVLIAVIGKRWLISSDEEGRRRLDNPDDLVRLEIAVALKRNIRVIPVLVDGALMPRSNELPDDLKLMVRRNALEVSHSRFNADLSHLVAALERVLEKADAERTEREKHRREVERPQREEKERLEIEEREKERLEAERLEQERLEAEASRRESERREQQQEKAVLQIPRPGLARQPASSPQPEGPTIALRPNQTKINKLLAVALAVALLAGIGAIWFAWQRERTVALAPMPILTPTQTPTATPSPA